MNEEVISEQLANLTEEESELLSSTIKIYLEDESDIVLDGKVADLFAYFKEIPYKYKSIFIFLFRTIKKGNHNLDEINYLFQKKHIINIFAELNTMPIELQNEFYDNIYLDLAPRYEYFLEKNNIKKRK